MLLSSKVKGRLENWGNPSCKLSSPFQVMENEGTIQRGSTPSCKVQTTSQRTHVGGGGALKSSSRDQDSPVWEVPRGLCEEQ